MKDINHSGDGGLYGELVSQRAIATIQVSNQSIAVDTAAEQSVSRPGPWHRGRAQRLVCCWRIYHPCRERNHHRIRLFSAPELATSRYPIQRPRARWLRELGLLGY